MIVGIRGKNNSDRDFGIQEKKALRPGSHLSY